jgi:Zn ribbon nucleic-acid-binding protein
MLYLRKESIDHLGRVIPAIRLEPTLQAIREGRCGPRDVVECLASAGQSGNKEAYQAIREAALSVGITHGPSDLAGRRCPI